MTIGLGIRRKLLLLMFAVNLASSAAFTGLTYTQLREAELAGIDARLQAVAYGGLRASTQAYHDRISGPDSIQEVEYLNVMRRLSGYADETGMTYVYTYMLYDGMVVTTATNATEAEVAGGTFDRFFHHYDDASPAMRKALASGQITFEDLSDSYGTFRSVYIPFTNTSGARFIAGADLDVAYVNAKMRRVLLLSGGIGIAGFAAFFFLGYVMVDRIVRPLMALAGHTGRLVDNNFAIDPETRAALAEIPRRRSDEVGALAMAMGRMVDQLQVYIDDLRETTKAKERVEGELSAARDIQMGILPRDFPAFPNRPEFDLHAIMEPAKAVGGDLYDFFLVDDRHLLFLVGDVSGKGVPAALFMAVAKTLFKSNAGRSDLAVDQIVERVNVELSHENPSELFITAFVGILDLETGTVEYTDAGHDAPFIRRADGSVERLDKVKGLALCVTDSFAYRRGRFSLRPGDTLVLFTDGVTEAQNFVDVVFTPERIGTELAGLALDTTAAAVNAHLMDAVVRFADGAEQFDDITLLTLRYRGPAAHLASAA